MKHIYYKNDFAVEITLLNASGEVVAPPDWKWHIEFTDGRRKYICSVDKGNANVVGNTIMCYLDNHKFCCGEIGYKFVQAIPDINYLDGFQNLITPKSLPIELWEQESDNDVNIQSSVVPAYVVYDAYMTAKANGYTGTAEDFYSALASVVGIADAEKKRVTAEITRNANEQERIENEENRLNAENERVNAEAQRVKNEKSFEDAIRDQVNNYKPIVIEGNVTNAADEEDITSENGLLKLKDRSALNGMGYVILRQNKDFVEQVIKANTIYEIRYDFDLLNTEIELPSNCKLLFCGGSISNGSIILNNTTINCDYSGLKNVSVKGSIANNEIDDTWFDTNSYLNDYKFLKMYFELGQEDKNNGKVYSMHKKYYVDLNDYDNTYSCSSFLGKFFIITQSFIINGNNAEIHVVKDGMAVSVDTAKTGIMRGIFGLLPQKEKQRIDISGILLDGGVGGTYEGDKIGQIPSSFSVNLNRNLISVRHDPEIYYNGIKCSGNYSYGRIVDCIFERCICESIIMMDGAYRLYDKFICRDCVFRNSAGAAYNVSGSSLVENCYFEHLSSGGGIETTLKKRSETIVTNCTFKNVQTICSILDGNNENSFDDSSLRNFIFTNCYCENSDSFKEFLNTNIYGISLTCVTNATISNCTFVNISGENTILLHSELNSVNKKYGYAGNVKVISCLFNKSTCIVSYYYSISFENCISVNCPLTVRPDANNLASYFNCKTIYRGIIGNAVKKITFPNNCFMYLSVKANNNYKLGQYIFRILKNDGVGFMVWSNNDEEAKTFSHSEHLLLYHKTNNTPQHCTYMANISPKNAEVTNDSGEIVKTITDVECTYSSRLDNIK